MPDILITEPLNEKNDNNIVPDGLFNIMHEKPYDQSRPHSPNEQSNKQINETDLSVFMLDSKPLPPLPPLPATVSPVLTRKAPPPPPPPPSIAPVLDPASANASVNLSSPKMNTTPTSTTLPSKTSATATATVTAKAAITKPKRPVFVHSPEMVRSRPRSRPHSPMSHYSSSIPSTTTTNNNKTSNSNSRYNSTEILDSIQQLTNSLEEDIFGKNRN